MTYVTFSTGGYCSRALVNNHGDETIITINREPITVAIRFFFLERLIGTNRDLGM